MNDRLYHHTECSFFLASACPFGLTTNQHISLSRVQCAILWKLKVSLGMEMGMLSVFETTREKIT